jgi:hypothetical protein
MTHVLVTVSRGIIGQVTFFNSALPAVRALAAFVKGMNVHDDDAAVFGPKGLVANAKSFLDENDQFIEDDQLVKEIMSEAEKSDWIYLIGNPDHPFGFMVASPDEPLGLKDPAEAVSELGQMRKGVGSHLKLYRVIQVENPVVSRAELERYNDDAGVEDFSFQLVEEYVEGYSKEGLKN